MKTANKPEKDLSAEEWADVEKTFSGFFGTCELLVDGYQITIERRFYKKNRLCNAVFVNGVWQGKWYTDEYPECIKFARRKTIPLYRKEERARILKTHKILHRSDRRLGLPKATLPDVDRVFIAFSPIWFSFSAFKRHLRANNNSIELVKKALIL